ncbi:MAG: TraR/DksA family transcriptional regulator [Gammaproteobacteria bacterium]
MPQDNFSDMQDRLETLQAELGERRERLAQHGRDGVPADFEEQATARENDDVVTSLSLQIDGELRQVAAALERIARGEFGRCLRCGGAIEPARIDALPYTEVCSNCAE